MAKPRVTLNQEDFQAHIESLYQIVAALETMFPGRPFTPDGHLVGSIGECLVADAYGLELMPPSNQGYDARTNDGKQVEIKATQAKSVGFRSCPEHTIVIRISKDGTFEEFYNGPGELIWATFENRKRPSNGQFQISLSKIMRLNSSVPEASRIQRLA